MRENAENTTYTKSINTANQSEVYKFLSKQNIAII